MTIKKTGNFTAWETALRDRRALLHVQARIRQMSLGSFGDAKSVGGGVMESRIHYGPGYRLYYMRRGEEVVILLVGGDKSTQRKDIETARQIAKGLREGDLP